MDGNGSPVCDGQGQDTETPDKTIEDDRHGRAALLDRNVLLTPPLGRTIASYSVS